MDDESIFRRAFEHSPHAMAILSADGRITALNAAFSALAGCGASELHDRELLGFCAPAPRRDADGPPTAESRHSASGVFRVPRLPKPGARWDGEVHWNDGSSDPRSLELSILSLEGCAEDAFLVIALSGDVAGPRSMQQRKLESLGVLASSIAHDLNNLLTGVLGHISFLRFAANDGTIDRDSISAIESGSRRAASLTQKILDFARGQNAETKVLNLSEVTAAGVNLIRAALPEGVSLVTRGLDEPHYVRGDESQLSQVVMNLTVNARDALPNGGTISIALSSVPLSDPMRCRKLGVAPGPFAVLSIEDDGLGIPPEVMERMFEPFFTTKVSHGTGLGLAIVSSIVKAHDGAITVLSEAGRGARFEVYLPLSSSAELLEEAESVEEALPTGKERILVVDDEEAVRTIIQRSLQHLGYEVVVARNGDEALNLYARQVGEFQLVIIDMIMPRMAGDELFERLRAIDVSVPVLIASGYSSDARTRAILQNGGLGFIQKPFAVEELAREVRRCLDVRR